MRVALAVWRGRISPVFDVSRKILVLDVHNGIVTGRKEETLEEVDPVRKAGKLSEWKVRKLICGAISRPLAALFAAYGIRTIPFVAGNAEEVIEAFLAGALPNRRMAMPGCCGQRRRFRGGRWGKTGEDRQGNQRKGGD
jgi:predicted Fe-Mo cluster-binding NifX family protein